MASRVKWTDSAWQELECAASFIARDSPKYSAALISEVKAAARSLQRFPTRGRIVPELKDTKVRELLIKSYRMIYEIGSARIVILAFIHGARRFPSHLQR